jgi:hypothetical protein
MYVAIAEASVSWTPALVKLLQLYSLVAHGIVDLTQQSTSSGYACRAVALAALSLPTPHLPSRITSTMPRAFHR